MNQLAFDALRIRPRRRTARRRAEDVPHRARPFTTAITRPTPWAGRLPTIPAKNTATVDLRLTAVKLLDL